MGDAPLFIPNQMGDPPALPGRQHQFDKCWSMNFSHAPAKLAKANRRTAECSMQNAEVDSCLVASAVRNSTFDILRFKKLIKC
jgi:hypothetical protein